jgi:hypothetical protein
MAGVRTTDVQRLTCPKCGGHATVVLLRKNGGQTVTCAAGNAVVAFATDPVKVS